MPDNQEILASYLPLGYKDPGYMTLLAELYLEAGQIEEGLSLIDELVKEVESKNKHQHESELFRLRGEFLWKQAQAKESIPSTESFKTIQDCFTRSLEVAQTQKAKSFELRTTTSLARLLKQKGQVQEAQEHLYNIYQWFTEGHDTHDLKAAKTLLDSLF